MSFTIKLAGTPYEFKAEATETILKPVTKPVFCCRAPAAAAPAVPARLKSFPALLHWDLMSLLL